jgi:hypothetical protein
MLGFDEKGCLQASADSKDQQIAQLKERLDAWRQYGHAMRVHSGIWARAIDKLHELGEWPE